MTYTITITKTERVVRKAGKQWEKLKDGGDYGYTPEIEKEVEVETKVLEQTLEHLDLVAVVKAINGLS